MKREFDPAALKREFPGLADPRLHYLDSAATAQVPEIVLNTLRRFEVEARANVHEGLHSRAQAATAAYNQARASVARFLHAGSDQEVVFTYGTTSPINLLAYPFGDLLKPGDEILLSILEHHSNLVPWQRLAQRRGVVLRFLPMTPDGRLDLDPAGVGIDRALPADCPHSLFERHRCTHRCRPCRSGSPCRWSKGHARWCAASAAWPHRS